MFSGWWYEIYSEIFLPWCMDAFTDLSIQSLCRLYEETLSRQFIFCKLCIVKEPAFFVCHSILYKKAECQVLWTTKECLPRNVWLVPFAKLLWRCRCRWCVFVAKVSVPFHYGMLLLNRYVLSDILSFFKIHVSFEQKYEHVVHSKKCWRSFVYEF